MRIYQTFLSILQSRDVMKHVAVFALLCVLLVGIGGAATYFSYLSQRETALDALLDRVQRDIKYTDGAWDLSEYNANPLIPDVFRLYVFSADGYIIDRWRPISGFMDLTDIKYLLGFQTPQTVSSITGQDWRIYSRPVTGSGADVLGVITVAHHDTAQDEAITDERLLAVTDTIYNALSIKDGQIDVSAITRRSIPFDISFQVVDQFNRLLIYNANTNSMNRIPGFIDPSYVRNEMNATNARQIQSAQGTNTFLVKSRQLTNETDQPMGVAIGATSISTLYRTLLTYFLVSGLAALLATVVFAVFTWRLMTTIKTRVLQTAAQTKQQLLSVAAVESLSFSKKDGVLRINKSKIQLTYATNQYYLCLAVFTAPKKKWEADELIDRFGEELTKDSWRKVYDAMAAINAKTGVILEEKLIVTSNKTYQLNPRLLDKVT